MDYLKAEKLRKEWGDKPCLHPNFEVETHLDSEYVAVKTGDYVCTCCGQDFTKEERDRLLRLVIIKNSFCYGNVQFYIEI